MEVITRTALRLSVICKEPSSRIVVVVLSLGFILLAPLILPRWMPQMGRVSHEISALLLVAFLLVAAGALAIARYSETYTFDKGQRTFVVRQAGLRVQMRTVRLKDIRAVEQVSDDANDVIREYVVLILGPHAERLQLPVRLYSFSAKERERFAGMVGSFLGVPVRAPE